MSFRKSQKKWLILCVGMVFITGLMPHVALADDELNAWAANLTKIELQMAGRVFESEDLSASNRRDGGNFARTVVSNRAARLRATVLLLDDLKAKTDKRASLELKEKIKDVLNRLLEFREAKDFLDNRAYLLWQAKADHLLQNDLLEIEELPTYLRDEWDLREDLILAHNGALLIQTEEAKEEFRKLQKEHEAFLESVPKLNAYLKESAHLAWFLETYFKGSAHMGAMVSPFEFGNTNYDPATYFIKSKVRNKVGIEIASPFTRVNEFESFDGLAALKVSPEPGQSRLDAKKIIWTHDIYNEERNTLRSRFSYEFSVSGREQSADKNASDENLVRSLFYDPLWNDEGEIRGHRVTIRENGPTGADHLEITEFSKDVDLGSEESSQKEWLFRGESRLEGKKFQNNFDFVYEIHPEKIDDVALKLLCTSGVAPYQEDGCINEEALRSFLKLSDIVPIVKNADRIVLLPSQKMVEIAYRDSLDKKAKTLIIREVAQDGKPILETATFGVVGFGVSSTYPDFESTFELKTGKRTTYKLHIEEKTGRRLYQAKEDLFSNDGTLQSEGMWSEIEERGFFGHARDWLAESTVFQWILGPIAKDLGEIGESVTSGWASVGAEILSWPLYPVSPSSSRDLEYRTRIEMARAFILGPEITAHVSKGIVEGALSALNPEEREAKLEKIREYYLNQIERDSIERGEPEHYRREFRKSFPSPSEMLDSPNFGETISRFIVFEYGGQYEGRADLKESGTAGYITEKGLGFSIELGEAAAIGFGMGRLTKAAQMMGKVPAVLALSGHIAIMSSVYSGIGLDALSVLDHPNAENIERLVKDIAILKVLKAADRYGQRQAKESPHYAARVLGLRLRNLLRMESEAAKSEVQARFREMAMRYHPDRNVGKSERIRVRLEEKFKEATEARDLLLKTIDLKTAHKPILPVVPRLLEELSKPEAQDVGGANPTDLASNVSPRSPPLAQSSALSAERALWQESHQPTVDAILGRPATREQWNALWDAHRVGNGERGKDGTLAAVGNYTLSQIREKNSILKKAGFSFDQIQGLMERGVIGDESDAQARGEAPKASDDAYLQETFTWLPNLGSSHEVTLWYINNFLIRLSGGFASGGSFYELSLEKILSYFKAIPDSLRTREHLGFHDIVGIRPFSYSAAESVVTIPEANRAYFSEMAASLSKWIEIYQEKGLGELILTLRELPGWARELEAFKKEVEGLEWGDLKAILGESLWGSRELSEENIAFQITEINQIYNALSKNDLKAAALRRVLFCLGMTRGMLGTQGREALTSAEAAIDQKVRILIQCLDFLIHHELVETPGERKNRAKDFLRAQMREMRSKVQKKLELKSGDSEVVTLLIANGLSGLLRGNFCKSPTCATGRHGENHQHRNSTLSQDNLLLVPIIDGDIRGYIELMRMRAEGHEAPVLVLRTIQFDGLTQNGARILLSHLYHKAKANGYLGIAVPKNMGGKSNLDENRNIINHMSQGGDPITVTTFHPTEWNAIRETFGSSGGVYYEDGADGAYILVDPQKLLPKDRLKIKESQEAPLLDDQRLASERERLRTSESYRLIGLGMGIQKGSFFDAYCKMLKSYGREAESELLESREEEDFFRRTVQFLEKLIPETFSAERREKEIKDRLGELLMSIGWKNLAKEKENEAWVGSLFKEFIAYLGQERMLHAYQCSMNLRTKVVLEWLPEAWIAPLFMRLSGNRLPPMIEFISDQGINRAMEVISELPEALVASHAIPLLEKETKSIGDVRGWMALLKGVDGRRRQLKSAVLNAYLKRQPSDIALGRELAYLINISATSQKSEEREFSVGLLEHRDRSRFPILSIYREILSASGWRDSSPMPHVASAQNDDGSSRGDSRGISLEEAKKRWLKDETHPSEAKAQFLMAQVGIPNSQFKEYFKLLPKAQKIEVNQIFDRRGNFNFFLERARTQGVEREFLDIAKMESFEFDGAPFPKVGEPKTFTMGEGNETRRVTLSRPIEIGRTAVTQLQYWLVTGKNPSFFKKDGVPDNRPVEQVSYNDAVEYLKELSQITGDTYRLPTEAEWEYAARGGTETTFYWGNDEASSDLYAWSYKNSNKKTHSVSELLPNAYGLFDISGNVWEWCSDWYGAAYPEGDLIDPKGPPSGSFRVNRGGSWGFIPRYLRSAYRSLNSSGCRVNFLGFRALRTKK